jgi:hypothetical protein
MRLCSTWILQRRKYGCPVPEHDHLLGRAAIWRHTFSLARDFSISSKLNLGGVSSFRRMVWRRSTRRFLSRNRTDLVTEHCTSWELETSVEKSMLLHCLLKTKNNEIFESLPQWENHINGNFGYYSEISSFVRKEVEGTIQNATFTQIHTRMNF